MTKLKIGVLAAILLAMTTFAAAQDKLQTIDGPSVDNETSRPSTTSAKTSDADDKKAASTSSNACESCRWFEPTAATVSFRYRNTQDVLDDPGFSQGQQRIVLGGKFKFDKAGKYSLNVQASTGYYFNWAFADSGLGNTSNEVIHRGAPTIATFATRELAPPIIDQTVSGYIAANYPGATPAQIAQLRPVLTAQFTPIVTAQVYNGFLAQVRSANTRTKGWNLYVRQAYFAAKPVDGLEFQYGSLGINKGVNTEATSYDDDGYVTGGRVTLRRPKNVFFDEISVTYAYLGDIFTPNFFRRTERVQQSNYHQFLVRKKFFGGKVDASADYTFQDGSDTYRQAVLFDTKKSKIVDSVRFETYQRPGTNIANGKAFKGGGGVSVQAEREFFKKLSVSGGVASIDRQYTVYGEYSTKGLDFYGFGLNGDQTGLGNRFITKANYKLTDEIGVSVLFSRAFANDSEDMKFYWNRQAFNIAVTYDVLKGAKKLGWFK